MGGPLKNPGTSSATGSDSKGRSKEQTQLQSQEEIEGEYSNQVENSKVSIRQGQRINERREDIEETLNKKIKIKDTHIYGSFAKGTMIGPVTKESDTDVMFVLDEKEHGEWLKQDNGPTNCLLTIKRAIENDPKYSKAEVKIDKNVVVVKFHDFKVEIAPAFEHPQGGYLIPDTSGKQSWIRTNPRMEKRILDAADNSHGGKLKGFIRIVKSWNEKKGKPLRSFHIEVLAYNHFRNKGEGELSYHEITKEFFERLQSYIRSPAYEPVYQDGVDTYLTGKQRAEAIRKAKEGRKHVKNSEEFLKKGEIEKSKEEIREVYNNPKT